MGEYRLGNNDSSNIDLFRAVVRARLPTRTLDAQGSGHFGAPRGTHIHNGIDLACYPGTSVYSAVYGEISKIGYPYSHDLKYRYVEVTDIEGLQWRYFYVKPSVNKGDVVDLDTVLGVTQELPYEGITQHCHLEIKDVNGDFLDPTERVAHP